MPAVHENYPCPDCNKPHTLYLEDGAATGDGKRYVFQCSAVRVFIRYTGTSARWKPVESRPQGSVTLHEMK
jgi:hypothetical protein